MLLLFDLVGLPLLRGVLALMLQKKILTLIGLELLMAMWLLLIMFQSTC